MNISKRTTVFTLLFICSACISPPLFAADNDLDQQYNSVEERRLVDSISKERERIRDEWALIDLRKKELKTIESGVDRKLAEIDDKLAELERKQKKIEQLLATKSAAEKKRIVSMAKIYDKMDPAKAAQAIAGLDTQLAADIMEQMKTKSAAKLMDAITSPKATDLSRTYTTLPVD